MNIKKTIVLIITITGLNCGATAQWLGTTNSTNGIYRQGNVGIGTTSAPSVKFEVSNGNASQPSFLQVDPLAPYTQMQLINTTTGSYTTIFDVTSKRAAGQSHNGGASMITLGYDATVILPETAPNKSSLGLRNDDPLGAFIGFGSSNASYSIYYDSKLIEVNGNPGFKYGRTNLSTNHADHFRWEFDGSEKMRVTSTGSLAIGTVLSSNPNNYKLAVNGKIGAKEVQVENTSSTWADYVFEPDYVLMSLEKVEAFVKENKHLPEIPSKAEVEQNGHKLGEMDVLLLKKVEELTLYIIEQEKRIRELELQVKK